MNNKLLFFAWLCLILLPAAYHQLQAQNALDSLTNPAYSVSEMLQLERRAKMDKEIFSASKKAESLFDAPLSASVLTREEIEASGATNVMEALRLVPGLIVRQMANGVYNIHIRGMSFMPLHAEEEFLTGMSKMALVMIDGRPVYNYMQGSTYWETLPVGLNEIDRIEVIRGAASSLYGPNAVKGVINILTNRRENAGSFVRANSQTGSQNTHLLGLMAGYQLGDKLQLTLSGQREYRERTSELHYSRMDSVYQQIGDFDGFMRGLMTGEEAAATVYPENHISLEKKHANLMLEYAPTAGVYAMVRSGYEKSRSLNLLYPDYDVSLHQTRSETGYVEGQFNIKGLSVKSSYLFGQQSPVYQLIHPYKTQFLDAEVSYAFQVGNLSVTPYLSYRKASYQHANNQQILDTPEKLNGYIFSNLDPELPFEQALALSIASAFRPPLAVLSGKTTIENPAVSITANYRLFNDKLRLAASARADQFSNLSTDVYLSYQFSANFKPDQNNMFRAVVAKAYASNTIQNTQLTLIQPGTFEVMPGLSVPSMNISQGAPDTRPFHNNLFELGYRAKVTKSFSLDVEFFRSDLEDLPGIILDSVYMDMQAQPIPQILVYEDFKNLPQKAKQMGLTVSLSFVSRNFWVKPFVTYSHTNIEGYSHHNHTAFIAENYPMAAGDASSHYLEGQTIEDRSNPNWTGGFYANLQFLGRFNFNLNSYYMSDQQYSRDEVERNQYSNLYATGNRLISNIKLSMDLNRSTSLFISARDISNKNAAEYYYTDPIQEMYFAGLSLHLK